MASTDRALGLKVKDYLELRGVETPFEERKHDSKKITGLFTSILEELGLDLQDDSLQETPTRLTKMYTQELFTGLNYNNFPKATIVENKMQYDEMVASRGIQVSSLCEHHFMPIWGKAYVAYVPKNAVLGLSKLNRIVEFFSRRPQIQERLTMQIYYALSYILNTEDVAVLIQSDHYCVRLRGIQDTSSDTVTSKLGGMFLANPEVRAEFLNLARGINE